MSRSTRRRRGWISGIVAGCLVATLAAACGPVASVAPQSVPLTSAGLPASTAQHPPASSGPQTAACVAQTLATMTPDERVGQLFMLGIAGGQVSSAERSAIEASHVGSVWLVNNRRGGVGSVRPLADEVQAMATGATHGVGFFVAADQEGGLVQRLSGAGFSTIPSALLQGRMPAATLEAAAAGWGHELASAGINVDLAPVMDVVPPGTDAANPPIGALDREYGHDPVTVADHGTAVLRGMARAGIGATLKHFPGLGRVTGNTDTTAGVVDATTTATDPYLASFRAGIGAGAPFVMVSLATYDQIDSGGPAVFSSQVIETLLRTALDFNGVVMSDDLSGAESVASVPSDDRALDFIAAGGDLMIVQGGPQTSSMATAVAHRAASDSGFAAQVNAAAGKILRAKAAYGLLPCA
jgi:beta-N-acetylhexosaminidase